MFGVLQLCVYLGTTLIWNGGKYVTSKLVVYTVQRLIPEYVNKKKYS
jgi:hypothetical protein